MNTHIRYLFLILFVFSSLFLRAQFDDKKYDKEYFLLGALNEYMGYQRTFTNRDNFYYQRVDILSSEDLKLTLYIDSLFSVDYNDITIVNNGAPMGIKIYSPALSKKIDDYYTYAPMGIYTEQMDTVYAGVLKNEKFGTEKQMLSFILGAYLCYGQNSQKADYLIQRLKDENQIEPYKEFKSDMYVFKLYNAKQKAKLCEALLDKLECKDVEYYYRKTIPSGNFVFFSPSQKIKEVIKAAELMKGQIELINTSHVEFTPTGEKFIWREVNKPSTKKMSD